MWYAFVHSWINLKISISFLIVTVGELVANYGLHTLCTDLSDWFLQLYFKLLLFIISHSRQTDLKSNFQPFPGQLPRSGRIYQVIGGLESTPSDWPWAVLLGRPEGPEGFTPVCGATLISEQHLLSAAHCFPDNPTEAQVITVARLGEYDFTDPDDSG